ncbi:MAG: TonB family protein [Chitinispirillaceae bacterium]|nr:TonB family protein [Chitinispirillaceae bacterium]
MPAALTSPFEHGEVTWKKGILFSTLFHLAMFISFPLVMYLTRSVERFERPQTFQLVAAPPSLKAFTPPVKKRLAKPVKRTVKKEASRPVPSNNRVSRDENLDELASLLEELPSPTRVSTVGDFKYNWYLANVSQKISRYWNPPSENKDLAVVVSFTIFREGTISEPRLHKASGNGTLDNLALRAVQLAAPFGKMPQGFSGNKIELTVTLIPTLN